ncbi:hypothetical protein [Desulfovibrio sp. ZJ369]|uniref:hypothetical protein n=1 Tax=Desulfovibrio sp. ZJ369 TaxID=2709793 RepID=UPI0013EC08D4|nr:hypothetical protein [Desulfovibrio sp. ZJ369]
MSATGIARMRTGQTVPEDQRELLPDVVVKPDDKVLVQLKDGTVGMATVDGIASSANLGPTGAELSFGVTLAPVTIVEDGGVAPECAAIALHIEAVEIGNT